MAAIKTFFFAEKKQLKNDKLLIENVIAANDGCIEWTMPPGMTLIAHAEKSLSDVYFCLDTVLNRT